MNKQELKQAILHKLETIHQTALNATQTAIDAATDEETVPEHKYDTLALEASYLAHGQAMRVKQCEEDIHRYQALVMRDATKESSAGLSSLVVLLDEEDQQRYFFVGPCAGGVSFEYQGKQIAIVTPSAPLGTVLIGKMASDEVELELGGRRSWFEIDKIY